MINGRIERGTKDYGCAMTIALGYDLSGATIRFDPMISRLERNVRIISIEGRGQCNRRYIAKPFNSTEKRWGVWDRKAKRYLTNSEVEALKSVEVREPWAV